MKILRITSLVILMVSLSLGLGFSKTRMQGSLEPSAPRIAQSLGMPNGTKVSSNVTASGNPSTAQPLGVEQLGTHLLRISHVLDDPCHQWYIPFLNAGWSESQWDTAKWIIYRESRCLQDAYNGEDAGLLQINRYHIPLVESYSLRYPEDLFDGETNLWIAYMLWLDYGWEPWIYKGVIPGD